MTIFAKSNWETVTIRREFEASRELVFRAWTDPIEVMKWWGPKGFTCPVCRIDLRVGGEYILCAKSMKGEEFWSKGIYREILLNERIVASDSFSDEKGNIRTAASVGLPPHWPSTLTLAISLSSESSKTIFTLIYDGLPPELVDSCKAGWHEALDKLSDLLREFHLHR